MTYPAGRQRRRNPHIREYLITAAIMRSYELKELLLSRSSLIGI
jgi:hypothetical protein